MNSIAPFFHTQLQLSIPIPNFHRLKGQWRPFDSTILSLSFSPRRRRRRPSRRNPNRNDSSLSASSDSGKLQFILAVEQLKNAAPGSLLHRTLSYCESKVHLFRSSGTEAYRDLRNLVTIEPGSNRVLVSCKASTVWFFGGALVWSFVVLGLVRVLVKLGLGFKRCGGVGRVELVRRRDRSLGGREVVVERRVVEGGERKSDVWSVDRGSKPMSKSSLRREERKLPAWWPGMAHSPVVEAYREEYKRQADKLIQAIMDGKLSGKDVSEDDILDLRRICRKSGIRLSFPMENARQSLYRSSVQYVINICSKARTPLVQIDGEEVRMFIAGLAYNFGLTALRAVTIVSAAVAAQTRLWFLQAWALEMQAKHSEATEELKKICRIHQIFPPEPSSENTLWAFASTIFGDLATVRLQDPTRISFEAPEMEMVARGLQKHLKLEQREFLLNKLVSVCGEQSTRSAGEALGLV